MIENTAGYQLIRDFYGERRAERSGVLLMDHIDQGIEILRRYGSDTTVMEAYAVHPLFQADIDLQNSFTLCTELSPLVVLYAMEYRNIANQFLSPKIIKEQVGGTSGNPRWNIRPAHPITLSPIQAVNQMLVADKVQNRKDFLQYHKGSHARSNELEFYFNYWLEALGISDSKYQELTEGL